PAEVEMDAGKIRAMAHPDDAPRFYESLHASADSLRPWTTDYRIRTPSGRLKWLHVDAVPEQGEDGLVTWYGFVMDVSNTKAMESELRVAAATFESQEGIFVTDVDGVILRVNRAFSEVTGYGNDEVVGRTPAFLKSDRQEAGFFQQLRAVLARDGGWLGEVWSQRKNGEPFPAWVTVSAVKEPDGQVTHFVAAFTDITEHKKAEERIYNLAFFDPLTNLPNRRLLIDRIRQAMVGSQRSRQYGAVVFLDLDHFKVLNDTRGHDIGDQLLVQAGLRLSTGVREGDTVARLGGDEFVVVLQDLGREAKEAAAIVEVVAEKLRDSINRPYDLGGYEYRLSASFGITLFVEREPGVDVLLKQADLALYQAKGAGRNAIRFFDPAMQRELDDRARLEAGLRDALRLDRLVLHYQPQVDADGRLIGAEALVRWQDANGNLIPPGDFILLAEETGLILPLGEWVLETTGALLQQWARDTRLAGLVLSINLSPRQFSQPNFVAQVSAVISRYGIAAGRWQMELTESVVLGNVDEVIERMKALKALGISFSLDDFGTGYSSLSYLRRLPIDQLKIDREFIRDVVQDPDDAAIVTAIIGLGTSLDLPVVAEGVETEEQRAFLQARACRLYQGYLFGRPVPVAEFEQLARRAAD
ncbi:MAG TPA: EAL domain-containing protein, partial [Rhodocyclaceae bacterium]|nr:EAL domain-containing protein [Rhodocyclaceae bacterium]